MPVTLSPAERLIVMALKLKPHQTKMELIDAIGVKQPHTARSAIRLLLAAGIIIQSTDLDAIYYDLAETQATNV